MRLRTLLVAELNEIAEGLNLTGAAEMPLAGGPGVKVVTPDPAARDPDREEIEEPRRAVLSEAQMLLWPQ